MAKAKILIYLTMLIFVVLTSGVSSIVRYVEIREILMEGLSERLETAAVMARASLPVDYHDKINDSSSISLEEFEKIVDKFNKLCVELDLEYLWSLMKIDGQIVFTSSTSPDKNTAGRKHAKFFEIHSNPEAYRDVFTSMEPQYQVIEDELGELNSILIPFRDSRNRPYLFGASVKMQQVDAYLEQYLRESIVLGFGYLLFGLIISFALITLLSRPISQTVRESRKIDKARFTKGIVLFFTIPFILLIAIVSYAGYLVLEINDTRHEAILAVSNWNKLNISTRNRFSLQEKVKTRDNWLEEVNTLESTLVSLKESDVAWILGDLTTSRIDRTYDVWVATKAKLMKGEELYRKTIKTPIGDKLAGMTYSTLVRMALVDSGERITDTRQLWLLYRLQDNLTNLKVSEQVLGQNLTETAADIGRRAQLLWKIVGIVTLLTSTIIVLLSFFSAAAFSRELQANEERLRITLDSIGDAVIVTDTGGGITLMNPIAENLTGWPFEEAQNKPLTEVFSIVSAQIRGPVINPVDQVLKSNKIIGLANHTMLIAREGDERQISDSAAPIRDAEGDITGVVLVFRDVTEDYQLRQRISASEEKHRVLFESSRDALFLLDPEHGYLDCNNAAMEMFGVSSKDDLLKLNPLELSPEFQPDGTPSVKKAKEAIEKAVREGSHFWEWLHKRIDGTEFQASVLTTRLELDGKVLLQGTIRDITARKQDEEELQQLRNYLSSIINSMPSVLIAINNEGVVTLWNKTAEKNTGTKVEVARGKPLSAVYPQIVPELDKITESIQTREIKQERNKPRFLKNGTRYEDITIYPLIASGVEGAVIRIDDVTEKVNMEEMMIQTEKMISVGGLAAGMAHEINNPLAGMLQSATLASTRITNLQMPANQRAAKAAGTSVEAIHDYMASRGIITTLNNIRESGERAAEIVGNMLSFARKGDSTRVTCKLPELLDQIVDLAGSDYSLKGEYDFRQIEIIREYKTDLPPVSCEAGKIQQVLLNILRNGAEAMQEERRSIEIGSAGEKPKDPKFILRLMHEKEANMISLEVEDNGPGMDETTRKRVFEPFFTTKPTDRGTGLGLSISYFIITENHKGTMNVESVIGKGSKFTIRLPLENS